MDIVVKCRACLKGHMVQRTNRRTNNTFFGCTAFPKCKHTMTINQYRREHERIGYDLIGERPNDEFDWDW